MMATRPRYQKRHYQDTARLLNARRPQGDPNHPALLAAVCLWDNLVRDFAALFEEDNPAFDPTVFFDACGMPSPTPDDHDEEAE